MTYPESRVVLNAVIIVVRVQRKLVLEYAFDLGNPMPCNDRDGFSYTCRYARSVVHGNDSELPVGLPEEFGFGNFESPLVCIHVLVEVFPVGPFAHGRQQRAPLTVAAELVNVALDLGDKVLFRNMRPSQMSGSCRFVAHRFVRCLQVLRVQHGDSICFVDRNEAEAAHLVVSKSTELSHRTAVVVMQRSIAMRSIVAVSHHGSDIYNQSQG